MASRRPLAVVSGSFAEVPTGDVLPADALSQTTREPSPSDQGLVGWSVDPATASAAISMPVNRGQAAWIPIRSTVTLTKLICSIATAGASLTVSGMALYSEAGSLLSNAPLPASTFQTVGNVVATLASPITITVTPGTTTGVYVVVWCAGSTLAQHFRSSGNTVVSNLSSVTSGFRNRFLVTDNTFTSSTPPASLFGGGATSAGAGYCLAVA